MDNPQDSKTHRGARGVRGEMRLDGERLCRARGVAPIQPGADAGDIARQQFAHTLDRMVGDALRRVAQPVFRIAPVQLGSLDQRAGADGCQKAECFRRDRI